MDYASTKVLSRSSEAIGRELDIFLPERNKAIEFGSWHWHRTRFEKDIEKRKMCEEAKIDLLIIYDGYDGPKLEESWIWTFQSVFTKQNRRQIQELCTLVSEYFEISVNTNSIDWKKIDAEVNHRIKKMDSAEIIRRIDPKSKGFLILDSFNNIHDTVTCQCSSCNNLWKTKITNLLYNRAACKKCSTMGKSRTNIKGVYALDLRGSIIKNIYLFQRHRKIQGYPLQRFVLFAKEHENQRVDMDGDMLKNMKIN